MKYGAMGSVRIHDSAGNLLFSFRASLPGGAQLTDWLSEHCETASAAGPDQNTKQVPDSQSFQRAYEMERRIPYAYA